MTTPLLDVRELTASYGPFRALFGVSFSVPEGGAVALLGPNGAGKSTVARVVTGLVAPTGGRIAFDGSDVTGWPAWKIARLGIAHAPEGRSVLSTLTVEENLALAFRRSLGRRGVADAIARAYDEFPRLRERRQQLAGTLSGGEQRTLSLARVLADPPRLLVVDELSLGLAPRLRCIHSTAAAVHQLISPELIASDVVVTNARDVHGPVVAEHAIHATGPIR